MATEMRRLIFPALFYAASASGAELGGVKMEERAAIAGTQLQLNGAGVRKRMVFDVYAIGLYLPKKTSSAQEAIAMSGPKRLHIHMLRDVGSEQFASALLERMGANNPEAEMKVLQPRIGELATLMHNMKQAKKGVAIELDWTGAAVQVSVDGKPAGRPIAGEDLYRALLRIWLGDKPGQPELKRALLGQR
jgi:hypothetical protein